MKKLILFLFLLSGFSKSSFAQTGFAFDSIANHPYICQAHTFDVEVFGMVASYSTQYGSQNYFISNDTIYAQFHFVSSVGPATPYPLYRKINIPAPFIFGRYKIVAQGIGNGQVLQTLTSVISICSSTPLATPEESKKEPELHIYPNPGHDLVQVKLPLPAKDATLKLTDATGKTVHTAEITSGIAETELNLQNLPAGLYLLEVFTAERKFTRKLLKR